MLTITYPTNEVVTNTYNGRSLPYSVSGSTAATIVSSTLYNQLGQVTRINLGNSTYNTFTYYGLDNSSGYYGKTWQIKTTKTTAGDRQSLTYTWDANGNLTQRQDAVSAQTETFTYDFLDRLTAVSGAYSNSFSYSTIGNITSKSGTSYTYGTKPHAVTAVGTTSYAYDANGNMTTRGSQTLTWDVENRLVGVTGGGATMSAVYDGDGNRVKKTEGGETVLCVNQYYEKNLSTGVETTHYYLGAKEVAYRKGTTLEYICQDHAGSTVLTTNSSGATVATIAYFPFGGIRTTSGTLNTDELFTGRPLDDTGLYYYGARYYDATIGRFVSADSTVPSPANPQSLNRYSYCLNNPLKYVDPSGHTAEESLANSINQLNAQALQFELLAAPILADPNAPPVFQGLAQNWSKVAASLRRSADAMEVALQNMVEARRKAEQAAQQSSSSTLDKISQGSFALAGVLIGDDVVTGGAGIIDDPIALGAAGVGIVTGAISLGLKLRDRLHSRTQTRTDYKRSEKVYITYTLRNAAGQVYSGRCSGIGSAATAVLKLYFSSHRMRAFGYYDVKIDRWAQGEGAYEAIRGREQQLIDYFGGVGNKRCGNAIRGVAKGNRMGRTYWQASTTRFGFLYRYTGY